MEHLTRAEEELMQILWELKEAFVKDIVLKYPEPKPAYNTVSTIIRILEKKKMVGYKAYGRSHQYFPILSKEEFLKSNTTNLMNSYFSGSPEKMLSYFAQENNISTQELEKILKNLDKL